MSLRIYLGCNGFTLSSGITSSTTGVQHAQITSNASFSDPTRYAPGARHAQYASWTPYAVRVCACARILHVWPVVSVCTVNPTPVTNTGRAIDKVNCPPLVLCTGNIKVVLSCAWIAHMHAHRCARTCGHKDRHMHTHAHTRTCAHDTHTHTHMCVSTHAIVLSTSNAGFTRKDFVCV